jgi:hypothetical protein
MGCYFRLRPSTGRRFPDTVSVTTSPPPGDQARLRESLALVVAQYHATISRYGRAQLRGTPFTADDLYSKIQYDIAAGTGWLWRVWEENQGSFQDPETAVLTAAQYARMTLLNTWKRELARRVTTDYFDLGHAAEAATSPQDQWVDHDDDRRRILDAVAHAGLTEGEACVVRGRLDELEKDELARRLARVLSQDDPARMEPGVRERFEGRLRQIQRRAYAKVRLYLQRQEKRGDDSE